MNGCILHCLWYFYYRPATQYPGVARLPALYPGAATEYRMGGTASAVIHHNPHQLQAPISLIDQAKLSRNPKPRKTPAAPASGGRLNGWRVVVRFAPDHQPGQA